MNKKAQFDFGFGPKKKKRVRPTKSEKNAIWDKQNGKCYMCPKRLSPTTSEYHHKDGNPSNWRLSNLALVCVECHKRETNLQRIKKVHKRRREAERRERDPLGLGGMFKAPRGRKQKSTFDIGLGSTSKKRSRKKKGPFDLF